MNANPIRRKKDLDSNGWSTSTATTITAEGLATELTEIALTLGDIVPGRSRQLVEPILPETVETARAGSLSKKFGLRPLPFHTDTAHWNIPCHYLVLACLDPGPVPTPTFLLDTRVVQLSERESLLCRSAVFLIRNGRLSFYGSIIDRDRPFIRVDPGCMTALSNQGAAALEVFSRERQAKNQIRHDWKPGDILILDNWRTLHARGLDEETASGRVLLRVMVR